MYKYRCIREAQKIGMNIKRLVCWQILPAFITLIVVYSGSVQAGRYSLTQALNGWFWLARSGPQHRTPQLQYLMRFIAVRRSGELLLSAISAPRPIPPGNSLQHIRHYPWRIQPETSIMMNFQNERVGYQVHEFGYEPQQIDVSGQPDLTEIADCLFDELLPHIPLWIENVHSYPAVLSGILYPSIRRGMASRAESDDIFTPELIAGRRLDAAGIYTPSFDKPGHYLFARGNYQEDGQIKYQNAGGESFLRLGATPHSGACSVFHWGQEMLVMTLDSVGNIVMLSTHRLLMALGWFSGQCRPDDDCAKPEEWDPGRTDFQRNNLPVPHTR